jgi:futalosine hydrolase
MSRPATLRERDAVLTHLPPDLRQRVTVVSGGVGKVNAALAVARSPRPDAVISLGIAGALPSGPAALGHTVVATASLYADEGIATPDGFFPAAQMGFPLAPWPGGVQPSGPDGPRADPLLLAALAPLCDHAGPVATVSTCSGTDVLSFAVAARTGAIAEAMEGAAAGHACLTADPPIRFIEVRVISNTTGDRPRQVWDLARAFEVLAGRSPVWLAAALGALG